MTPDEFVAEHGFPGTPAGERMAADLAKVEVAIGSLRITPQDPDQQARDLTSAMQRMNQFVPIETTSPRAQYVSRHLEEVDYRDSTGDRVELGIAASGVEATLALAQEVSNLRQSLERLLRKETT